MQPEGHPLETRSWAWTGRGLPVWGSCTRWVLLNWAPPPHRVGGDYSQGDLGTKTSNWLRVEFTSRVHAAHLPRSLAAPGSVSSLGGSTCSQEPSINRSEKSLWYGWKEAKGVKYKKTRELSSKSTGIGDVLSLSKNRKEQDDTQELEITIGRQGPFHAGAVSLLWVVCVVCSRWALSCCWRLASFSFTFAPLTVIVVLFSNYIICPWPFLAFAS